MSRAARPARALQSPQARPSLQKLNLPCRTRFESATGVGWVAYPHGVRPRKRGGTGAVALPSPHLWHGDALLTHTHARIDTHTRTDYVAPGRTSQISGYCYGNTRSCPEPDPMRPDRSIVRLGGASRVGRPIPKLVAVRTKAPLFAGQFGFESGRVPERRVPEHRARRTDGSCLSGQ